MTVSGAAVTSPAVPLALEMSPADASLERRVSLLILTAAPLLFLLFLALAPAVNPTFDDAKYVGVGRNFLAGNGPTTVFGTVFLKHSPLWPMIIVLPERVAGIHPIVTGHVLNALSGAVTILLVGYLGWRVRPVIGAIAAVLFGSLPYVFDIARTAGIDLPSIALTLGYIALGLSVAKRGSLRWAAVLGAVFAIAFLIKETILPFAVVPFIVGMMWGVRWTTLARTAAVTLAVASVGMAWWFAMYAGYAHRVYRADFPEWTLVPSAIAVVVAVALGLAAGPIAEGLHRRGWDAAVERRVPPRIRGRGFLGWAAVAAWFVLLSVFFDRTPKLLGASLFDPDQIRYAIVNSLASVRLALAFGLGSVLLVVELVRDRRRVAQASVDALVATICGIPLILLVIGVGETPRHYIAELALIVLAGTIGWYQGLLRLAERDRPTMILTAVLAVAAGAIVGLSAIQRLSPSVVVAGLAAAALALLVMAVGLRWLRRRGRLALAGVLAASLVFIGGLAAVGVRAIRLPDRTDAIEAAASADTIAWIRATVPPGGTIAFGPYLSMATAIDLPAGYRAILVRDTLAIADPAAALGLRGAAGTAQDFIAVDVAPLKANQFSVFTAGQMLTQLRDSQALYYVYPVSHRYTSKSVLGALTADRGFSEVGSARTYVGPDDTIDVHTYRLDPAALDIPADRLFIARDALERLVDRLERDPAVGAVAAGNLVDRIVPPADGSEADLLARLKTLAGR